MNIPVELKGLQQWVCWRKFSRRVGQVAKVPICPVTGRYASVSDPTTWGSFSQVVAYQSSNSSIAGVGFVFSENDSYVGVDFDHCRDPKSAKIDQKVMDHVKTLDSYTEISISGTGLHVIVKAALPAGGCRRGGIEIYDRRRYFVMTGKHLTGTPLGIHNRKPELLSLYEKEIQSSPAKPECAHPMFTLIVDDQTLTHRISQSRQGQKFGRLMDGDTSGYPSASEADLALCAILAFWTPDTMQIHRIFCSSGLFREKWNRCHSVTGLTYGEMTIQLACSN